MSPLIPLLVLLFGAAGMAFGLSPRFRASGGLAAGAAALALLATLGLGPWLSVTSRLSEWLPEALFPAHLHLRADPATWLLAAGLLAMIAATLITGLARPGGRRLAIRAAILLIGVAAFGAVLAENLLTLAVMWAVLDVIYFVALLSQLDRTTRATTQAVISLAVNSAGTLSVVVASTVALTAAGPTESAGEMAGVPILLLTLAALLRLGLFPPRLGLPDEAVSRRGLSVVLRLGPAAAALISLMRAVGAGIPDATRPWLTAAGLGAVLFAGFQLWTSEDPRGESAAFVWSLSGLALLAGVWGGAEAEMGLLAFGLLSVLAGAILFLSTGAGPDERSAAVLPVIAVLALAGAPLTPGWSANRVLLGGAAEAGAWWLLPLIWAGQSMLVAGAFRIAFTPPAWAGPADPATRLVHAFGLALPAVFVLALGLFANPVARFLGVPSAALGFSGPTYWGLGGFILTALLGYGLFRFEIDVQTRASALSGRMVAVARLGWLYQLAWAVYRGTTRTLLGVAGVLEGEGAVLWTLVAALLVWILLRPK